MPRSEKGTVVERANRSVVASGWGVGGGDNYKGAGGGTVEVVEPLCVERGGDIRHYAPVKTHRTVHHRSEFYCMQIF